MTNRTREIFDFAQAEPIAVKDIELMARECDDEEIGHLEQVAGNVLEAVHRTDLRFEDDEDEDVQEDSLC